MPKGYPSKKCKSCDRPIEECGPLTASYLCKVCAEHRYMENIAQLREHRGPYFERWRRQMAASVGGLLVDDLIERN